MCPKKKITDQCFCFLMIYEFTGVTNFEKLAKIFTGYKITLFSAQSSDIFIGTHPEKKKLLKKLLRKKLKIIII